MFYEHVFQSKTVLKRHVHVSLEYPFNQYFPLFFKEILQELNEEDLKQANQTGEELLSRLPDDEKEILQERLRSLNERWRNSRDQLLAKCADLEHKTLSQQYLDKIQLAQDEALEIDQLIKEINQSEPENVEELRKQCKVSSIRFHEMDQKSRDILLVVHSIFRRIIITSSES